MQRNGYFVNALQEDREMTASVVIINSISWNQKPVPYPTPPPILVNWALTAGRIKTAINKLTKSFFIEI